MISITNETIDTNVVLEAVQDHRAGAVVLFLGTTRSITGDRKTDSLDYECYESMAIKKLEELESIGRQRWDVIGVNIVHRLGHLLPGEASVAVAVSSPHRAAAFKCGQWLIDTLKEDVPIWKKENWSDGTKDWVHPGLED
ncbi:MAG: molybdopterin converting factor [Planctomycetaceae bacterium]|nr:molybdopterin converting factor [Planctomycetaceae bacterium]|tara:strand:+ start:2180 stop:2599 length:420 start_codon:yes stop_codon:yes gene_type:complete